MAEVTRPVAAGAQGPRLRREMGPVAVLFSSVGIVIGSGWLLGAFHASILAGPAALLSWIIGAAAMLVIALTLAELGGMYAVAGGMVRGLILLFLGVVTRPRAARPKPDWFAGYWIPIWVLGVLILSYLGSFQSGGGSDKIPGTPLTGGTGHVLPFGWDILVLAVWSLVIWFIAVPSRLNQEQAKAYIEEFSAEEAVLEPAE